MTEGSVVNEHPRKFTLNDTPSDSSLDAADGWVDMDVRWLVTDATQGARHGVVGITVFPAGSRHERHRHPNCEEFEYLLSGSGVCFVGDEDVAVQAGEGVFIPVDEYHGFANTSADEAVMIWGYMGVPSLADAGYVTAQEDGR